MDFVDLDRVLDEFEEEEKQALSLVPGHELKPSGFIEFLEKHKEQDWQRISSGSLSNTDGFKLDGQTVQDSVSLAYDEPFDISSKTKLDSFSDQGPDSLSSGGYDRSPSGKKIGYQSEIVTSLSRVNSNGDSTSPVGAVYPSMNGYERTGIATRSERKGTVACQASGVQTEALSPASEEELMSSPFPKTDILIDGHGDTSVDASLIGSATGEQNHSPIYASMEPTHIVPANGCSSTDVEQTAQRFMSESQALSGNHVRDVMQGEFSSLTESSDNSGKPPNPSPVVGFGDSPEDDLDEDEVNMYLDGVIETVSENSYTENPELSGSNQHITNRVPEPFPSQSVVSRNLAEEIAEAEPNVAPSFRSQFPKKFCPDKAIERQSAGSTLDPDVLSGLGPSPQPAENTPLNNINTNAGSGMGLPRDRDAAFDSVLVEKMEIEHILDHKLSHQHAAAIGNQLLHSEMEIEGVLHEVIQNQSTGLRNNLHQNSSQPGEKLGTTLYTDQNTLSVDPAKKSPGSPMLGVGARPKDPSAIKRNRPNTLLGLSKVNLDFPTVVKEVEGEATDLQASQQQNPVASTSNAQHKSQPLQMPLARHVETNFKSLDPQVSDAERHRMDSDMHQRPICSPAAQDTSFQNDVGGALLADDTSGGGGESSMGSPPSEHADDPNNSSAAAAGVKRPTSLDLPHRPGFGDAENPGEESSGASDAQSSAPVEETPPESEASGVVEEEEATDPGTVGQSGPGVVDYTSELASGGSYTVYGGQGGLGQEPPFWIPDSEAPACMMCQTKFTMWKRRHHCRACGKVLCSACCNLRALLPYLDNKEARVCVECHLVLTKDPRPGGVGNSPNPNNPTEYCSKVPPIQQASGNTNPPTVMVPTGVLKTSGSQKKASEPKQVMFSDGIRPGGDLTELDGPEQTRRRKSIRGSQRKSGNTGGPPQPASNEAQAPKTKEESLGRTSSLIPMEGLPPLYIITGDTGTIETDEVLNQIDYTSDYKSIDGPMISYAVNKNLSVGVKIINMDCCVHRWCWCFVTRGMCTAGQAEIVVLLEMLPEEVAMETGLIPPSDMFQHFHELYTEALKGNFVCNMGHTILSQGFLDSRENGGFLYLQPTFQCLSKLPLPEPPYLVGILLQKWEVPWAKVFPIRLLLRLGAEYRYYPCPLVSVRNRKPVFYEIGHTIINLLADFRNYQYMLSQIRGVTVHMEKKKTVIKFPRNRYNEVMRVVRNSNEHVMALGSAFSSEADSHLVCIQGEDGTYQTQAINIQNKPRLVTGASFVVFNGALKASSGLRAKLSIVEDGLMIQVLPETLAKLKQTLVDMTSYTIQCGPVEQEEPEESVEIGWGPNDVGFNLGVKSPLDGTSLEGVEFVSVKCPMDYLATNDDQVYQGLAIRWTHVYFLRSGQEEEELGGEEDSGRPTVRHADPVDLSRLTEAVAQATCTALARHLGLLRRDGCIKLGLRVSLTSNAVGFEIGSKGEALPAAIVSDLDTYLVPIVHQASEEGIVMELIFYIVD